MSNDARNIKRLLILTKHFPFNRGETPAESYLETEIGLVSGSFDEVMIVATEAAATCELVEPVPSNVRAFALGFVQTKREKAKCLSRGVWGLQRSEPSKAAKSDEGLTLQQALFQKYFIGKALRKWDAVKALLAEKGFSPTHVYSFWFHDTSLLACWAKKKYLCERAVSRAHRYDLYHNRTRCQKLPCRVYMLSELDAVLPCSNDGADYLKALYPQFACKVEACYLGTRDLPDKSAEVQGDVFQIVSCSSMIKVKRVDLLAEAISLLDREGRRIEWTHYGDGPEMGAVKDSASRYENVKAFFPGNLPNVDLLDRYEKEHIDLFVNVSSSEGLPISIMEACGFGVPVLATDVGGTHEIVKPGLNGFLMEEDVSPDKIADSIRKFMDSERRNQAAMRHGAREIWRKSFMASHSAQVLLSALRRL